jgi:hypothetical protein
LLRTASILHVVYIVCDAETEAVEQGHFEGQPEHTGVVWSRSFITLLIKISATILDRKGRLPPFGCGRAREEVNVEVEMVHYTTDTWEQHLHVDVPLSP